MPCPHMEMKIVSRGKGQSAVSSSAYQAGENLYSEYDKQTKYNASRTDVIHKEVMLPKNAPEAYVDRGILWNAVEKNEKQWNAQLARKFIIALPRELNHEQQIQLVQEYCREQFVSKGMICDYAIHDKGDGNPHVHIMLTLRAIDENGKWLPKSRKIYDLDKEGNRIRLPSGQWKSHKENTVDWNDQKYGEIWRHEWEVLQNRFLERAGSEARVDMRSYERQGNELVPENHLGPSVSYLEKQGIKTEIGNLNRQIRKSNSLIASIRKAIKSLFDWIKECTKLLTDTKVIDNPDDYSLYDVLMAYIDLRKEERANWNSRAQSKSNIKDYEKVFHLARVMEEKGIYTVNDLGAFLDKTQQKSADLSKEIKSKEQRIRDIDAIFKAVDTMKSTRAVWEEYESIYWKGRKEKFKESHCDDLNAYRKAEYLLKKLQVTLPINRKELKQESARLSYEVESLTKQSSQIKQTLDELKHLRWLTRKVIPDALPVLIDGKQSFNDQIESNSNHVELQELKEKSFAQLDRRYQSIMQKSIIEDEYEKPQMQEAYDEQKQSQPIKRTQNPERE